MAGRENPVLAAYKRVAILKAIVAAERVRAEGKPYDDRNIALGLIEPDQPNGDVRTAVRNRFNEIEVLLDHIALLHIAASFEAEAKARLDTVAGVARAAIQKSRDRNGRWATKLVRGAADFEGLYAIGEIIGLASGDMSAFGIIRKLRNEFSHGMPANAVPPITAEDARNVLVEALARIR